MKILLRGGVVVSLEWRKVRYRDEKSTPRGVCSKSGVEKGKL